MEAPKLKILDVQIPPDTYQSEGMLSIDGDKEDTYSAFYNPDVIYASFGERELRMQMIIPYQGKELLPLIVYIQGSAWFPQNLYSAIPQLSDFAHAGYVVASVEYRHSLEAKFPAQIVDVKTAIRFLRQHAEKYRIDPDRIAIWGDSSGGHLASMAGVSEGIERFNSDLYTSQSSHVKAVVNFYGPSDLLQMNKYPSIVDHDDPEAPESVLIGGPIQQNIEKANEANPISYITKGKNLPPFLIMHGDQDELVPFNQSVLLYEALQAAGQDVTFYKVKGAGHGTRFWTPTVLEIVRSFLSENV